MIRVFIEPTRTVAVKVDINNTVRFIESNTWVSIKGGLEEDVSKLCPFSMTDVEFVDCTLDSTLGTISTGASADMFTS